MTVEKNLIELARVDERDLAFERHGDKCWINLTFIAQQFGKRPIDWLKTQSARDYLAVARKKANPSKAKVNIFTLAENELIITRTGGNNPYERGTWCTDTRVARRFFQWLSPEYAWEVDDFLDRIARGEAIVSDGNTFMFRGKEWVSCTAYCRQFGRTMHSFYGLKASYPYSFMFVEGQWYMSRDLFNMKEVQARFESSRSEIRRQNADRQLSFEFAGMEPEGKEG